MQKFILTMVLIGNVCVGFELAIDHEDTWAEFGGHTTTSDLHAGLVDGGEDSDCDHCCHGTAHFSGATPPDVTVQFLRASSAIPRSDRANYFTSRSPPTPPPNA